MEKNVHPTAPTRSAASSYEAPVLTARPWESHRIFCTSGPVLDVENVVIDNYDD